MSKSKASAYRVEFNARSYVSNMAWDFKRLGKPSNVSLAGFVQTLEESAMPGGVNAHLGDLGIEAASIVRNANGDLMAQYQATA